MMSGKALKLGFIVAALAAYAWGDTFKGIDFVAVTGPNSADLDSDLERNGYGAVSYNYYISQYEISYAQFFLSGVGSGDENFWADSLGPNAPAVKFSWHEAARYCNWLTSGDDTIGAYTINGSGKVTDIMSREDIFLAGGQFFVLPTEDEWYKAAYYTGAGYSLYANGTDTAPTAGDAIYGDTTAWLTTDGALEVNNQTYNMMGNVWEWTESALYSGGFTNGVGQEIAQDIAFRGGGYNSDLLKLEAATRSSDPAEFGHPTIGLRVVAVPEPGTMSLMGLSTITLFATRSIRRRKRLGSSILPYAREYLCDQFLLADGALQSEQPEPSYEWLMEWNFLKERCASTWHAIYHTCKDLDHRFWNRMVVLHERNVAKRINRRKVLKQKFLSGFDAFLELIMK